MRPFSLADYVGQRHLVGPGCILRNMIDSGNLSSFILWGPPGVGKTTLASIIARTLDREFYTLSAVSSGVTVRSSFPLIPVVSMRFPLFSARANSTRRSAMPCKASI